MHHLHGWRLLLGRLLLVLLATGQVSAPGPAGDANNTTTTRSLTRAQQQNKHHDELMQSNVGRLSKSHRSGASNSSASSSGQEEPPQVLAEPSTVSNRSGTGTHSEWPQSANLSGPRFTGMQIGAPPTQTQQSQYKLPSWFNFNAFKRLYGKRYGTRHSDELHKRIYLSTSLKVFEQRALYRLGRVDSLASVNELSDLTSEQLDEFRGRLAKAAASPSVQTSNNQTTILKDPEGPAQECCSYDQVYSRIIRLLSSATDSNDTSLSRALVDELEQKPLLDIHLNVDDEPPTAADAELTSNHVQQRQTRPTNNRNHLEQLKADSSSTSPAKPERLHLDLSSNPGGPSGRRQQQASETTPSRSLPEQQQNKQTKSSTSSELSGPGTNSTTAGSGDRPLTQVAGDGNAVARAKPSAKTTTSLAGGANEDHDLKRQVPGDGGGSGLDQRAAAARQHQHHEPSSKLLASAVGRMEPLERADNKDRLSLEAAAPPPTSMPPTRQQLIVGLGRPADSKANGKAARAQSWSGSSGSQSDATITTSSLTTTTTTNRPLNDNSNRSVVAARAHHHPNHLKQQPQSSRQREAYPSRETTRGGSTATATTTVETGEDDDEFGGSSARSSLAGGVSEELAEAVRAQVAEQLSVSSPIGRELTRQLSAYFGQPVEIRAVRPLGSGSSIASGSKSAASASRATDRPSAKAK